MNNPKLNNPKCPYCGKEMEFRRTAIGCYYRCPMCKATSPVKTAKHAYAAAMKRHKEELDE